MEERQRLAADMHDGLAQTLSYLGHRIDAVTELAGDNRVDQVITTGEDMREVVDRASLEVRQLIASLQSKPTPPPSVQNLLRDIVRQASDHGSPPIRVETDLETPLFVAAPTAEQVARIAREALLNAQRHADAETIEVSLHAENGEFLLVIEDDGRGFDPATISADRRNHFGLSIMRARAARLSGSLLVESAPAAGTRVILRWPSDATLVPQNPG